ncbi:hypothetical protein PS9374_04783 [Planomonospora sphaerica]|uniref:Uncharacterized protein n=1 Tax=Planomonospora sphaerica TaxID=161355 RepID=A0A161MCS5_9ACTN|nr:hypothetical protein [Planomonospora sphaerica]GAT69113.1 hypothetical protein PS9374_04783 [Planomonospora sphaerica]
MDNCRAAPPVVDETTAERQDRALAVVQRLLRERGIRARCQHTISLGLFADRAAGHSWPDRPMRRYWVDHFPPELAVLGPQGECDATVTVDSCSGYLVWLRTASGLQPFRNDDPHLVVNLITALWPEQR